ncbi:hypothetical protein LWI29_014319 [Acer saccharum]|uniref:Uncharacterized protein n=1 Tax=Acer saccharum TaxID=4024 RepID=A0AA39SVJ7_ACESA|nr:hypothetical protein LWI29_014319 [Acer saccharum]
MEATSLKKTTFVKSKEVDNAQTPQQSTKWVEVGESSKQAQARIPTRAPPQARAPQPRPPQIRAPQPRPPQPRPPQQRIPQAQHGVGKVSVEQLAGEKKVVGTFPPKDTAGSSSDGAENTAAVAASIALISIAVASSILLQVGKNAPQKNFQYPLLYIIVIVELRCMHGRRSLGRGLYPPLDGTNHVERSMREFEEIPRQAMSTEGQDPKREKEAHPREEITEETLTNQGQRMTGGRFDVSASMETAIEISRMNKKMESLTSYIESMGFPKARVKMLGRQEATPSDQFSDSEGFNDMNQGQKQDEVQAMGFQGQGNNPYSNTYNLGLRNHPNLSWSNNNNVLNPQHRNQQGGYQQGRNSQGGYRQREQQGGNQQGGYP